MATQQREICIPFPRSKRRKLAPQNESDHGSFLPTPAEIRQQCSLIQMGWDELTRRERQVMVTHLSRKERRDDVIEAAYAALDAKLQGIRDRRYGFAG